MSIKETLKIVSDMADLYKIDKPYIVGGLPRDMYLQREIKTTDVDLTTNSSDVLRLGVLCADKLNFPFELSDDGHVTVFLLDYDLDFSSNFVSQKVVEWLDGKFKGFEEAFSRDFTINTLHRELNSDAFFDPTGMAVEDIKKGIIRTPVPAEITLTDDPRRVYRAINLAVRYNFKIDNDIKEFVLSNPDMFASGKIKDKYITLKINKSLNQDPIKTIHLLKEFGLFDKVPLIGRFKDYLIENKLVIEYLQPEIKKDAQAKITNWDQYSNQGHEYKYIADWWKSNYNKFPNHNGSFYSWAKWYMNKYKNEWGSHKGPQETLSIMKEEASSMPAELSNKKEENKSITRNKKIFSGNYLSKLNYDKNADLSNISIDAKRFLEYLGDTAEKLNIEKPYVTSGYRSIDRQANVMYKNWKRNGGIKNGREYLLNIYGKTYGSQIADVFEKFENKWQALENAKKIIQNYPSKHMSGNAIDLATTQDIKKAIDYIKNSGLFSIKVVDETHTAGPHWHITVEGSNLNSRIATILQRKEYATKIVANIIDTVGDSHE